MPAARRSRTTVRRSRLTLLGVAATIVGSLVSFAGSGGGYEFLSPKFKWPGNPAKISYYNAAKKQDPAVRDAVAAWNGSGIGIHFKRTANKRHADVVIKADKQSQCGNGLALPFIVDGEPKHAEVLLGASRTGNFLNDPKECRYVDALVASHELGHVLGLDHDDTECALMNSSVQVNSEGNGKAPRGAAPAECRPAEVDTWFCRVLTSDDLAGAKKLYGGHPRVRKEDYCRTGSKHRIVARGSTRTMEIDNPASGTDGPLTPLIR